LYFSCYFDCTLKSLKFIVLEAFRLVVALLSLRNIILIYNSYNPQTSGPDTRVVGHLVTVRPGITKLNFIVVRLVLHRNISRGKLTILISVSKI